MASPLFTVAYAHEQTLPIHETLARPVTPTSERNLTSPDGKKSFYFDARGAHLKNSETGEQIDLGSDFNQYYNPITFSADSKKVYVLSVSSDDFGWRPNENSIISYDLDNLSEKSKVLFSVSGSVKNPIVADDGSSFIFVYTSSGKDIYTAFDARTGAHTSLNTSSSGVEGNGTISEAVLVNGGTFAIFVSTSSNLVAGDTNGVADAFLKNLMTGEVTRLSTSGAGVQADGASGGVAVSADGSKILFHSTATNLVADDANGFQDVFVKDLATGRVTLVSTSADGLQGNGASGDGVFSPDGRAVAFRSTAANLVANDLNGRQDVFLKTLATDAVTSLSIIGSISVPVTGAPAFSRDGGTVTFGQYSYDVDNAGLLIIDAKYTASSTSELDSITVSKGDGSELDFYRFHPFQTTQLVGLDYDRDGDFKATITGLRNTLTFEGLASGIPVSSESFTVKVRAHSGPQTFTGNGTGELVLLSSGDDRADGGSGDDTLYGYAGADDLSGGIGNDVLDGGLGDDILRGGVGDDRYYLDNVADRVVEAKGAGRDTVIASFSATLDANVEDLVLTGTAGLTGTGNALDNTITGNGAGNTLLGQDGNDVLDGGAGADRLVGGAGNDRYIVDGLGDVVEEQAGGGIDTVVSSVNLVLGNNIENLILSGIGDPAKGIFPPTKGTGNILDNVITGNQLNNTLAGGQGDDGLVGAAGSDRLFGDTGTDRLEGGDGNDVLDGGVGADTMIGGAGDDNYIISDAGDKIVETAGGGSDSVSVNFDWTLAIGSNIENIYVKIYTANKSFKFVGNELNNSLSGSGGDDILDGRAGADYMSGERGNDTYFVDNANDRVVEIDYNSKSYGKDTVVASVGFALSADASIETLKFADNRAAGNLELTGNAIGQTLIGNGGASRLFGRGGDDTYIVDGGDDLVFEAGAEGHDTVITSGSYVLGIGQEIETLRLASSTSTAARNLTGNGFSNALFGNAGANLLDGDGGADTLYGLAGNDTYTVDNAGDRVFEKAGQGTDTVRAFVSYALAAGQSIEILKLAGTASLDLTGNEIANTLRDNAGNNRLDGGAGDDTLVSTGGRDVLIGGAGSDSAVIDRSGASASLRFVMKSVNETTTLIGDGTTTTSIGNLTLTGGTGHDVFTTLNGIDTLSGGAGNDVLDGGAGADRLIGGTGNDTLIVDTTGDRVFEASREGIDKVLSSVSYTLQAGQEIEMLQLLSSTGKAALSLTGNEFGQTLVGNTGANLLDGKAASDVLIGGRGADSFAFSTALGSGNVDRIADFAAEDTMRLSKSVFAALAPGQLKANEFKDIAKAKVDADDHILYDSRNGNLFYDADGSGKGLAVKFAVLDNKAAINATDFLIV